MKIVIAAATGFEIEPLKQFVNKNTSSRLAEHQVSFLETGVGTMAATYALTKYLCGDKPGFLIQAGIAGSFTNTLPPGHVTVIGEEIMGDLGVMEKDGYKDLFDLELKQPSEPPFTDKRLINPWLETRNFLQWPVARGLTVNEITTVPERIALLKEKYNCDLESMEGAAFHYVCLLQKVPFLQIRSVSNYIGDRNKANWKLTESINNLNHELVRLIENITQL